MTESQTTRSFGEYAAYYDLLYRDKDYDGEALFVASVLEDLAGGGPLRILELGSGTGRHARVLAARGHLVHGVDLSPEMVERARSELDGGPREIRERLTFTQGDVQSVRVGETFDAVVSLFHVMSYQTRQQDFEAALATARAHVRTGGLFLFDAWYGPGVLTDPPSVRVKRAVGPDFSVMRVAEPELRPSESCVDVRFTVFVFSSPDEVARVIRESHRMRYWFHPEVAAAASRAGFELVELSEWMTRRPPQVSTWNAHWVLRAAP